MRWEHKDAGKQPSHIQYLKHSDSISADHGEVWKDTSSTWAQMVLGKSEENLEHEFHGLLFLISNATRVFSYKM